jgi:hypothetical protein
VHLLGRLRQFFRLHRVSLLVVALLTLVLVLVGQTSGQAVDSVHTWAFSSGHGASRLFFGLAATLLLSLVVYESGCRLYWVTYEDRPVPWVFWVCFAALALVGGGVVLGFGGSAGLFVLAGIAVLLVLLDTPWRSAAAGGPRQLADHSSHAPEYLAMVPLVAMAAVADAALIDGALTGAVEWAPLFAALFLAITAGMFTREERQAKLEQPAWWVWVASGVGIVGAGLIVLAADNAWVAASAGIVSVAGLWAYSVWVFRRDNKTPRPMLALAFALAAGIALLVAVHFNVQGVAPALGTLGVVCLGLAALLVAGHVAVEKSLQYRSPRLLSEHGIKRLPIVSLVLVAWIVAGLLPLKTHDVRVVTRPELAGANAYVPPTSLSSAFASWQAAQPEFKPGADKGSGQVVPFVLVAAHGGGIRAAYWTALALDCIVAGKPSERSCEGERRDVFGQTRAARRIFLASGVSGGAVGLYEYARELLLAGMLAGDDHGPKWIDQRLSNDFASPAIGWAFFADLPNHFLGFHHDRAAVLEDSFDRVWPRGGPEPSLRHVWDLRFSPAGGVARRRARNLPLLVTNATVAGGKTRAVVSAADLSVWPALDTADEARGTLPDDRPLAGSVEVSDTLCVTHDLRLSSAAILGARFPYVTPSGHIGSGCPGNSKDDEKSTCNSSGTCGVDLVDGGYSDNSGLFTIEELWPSIRELVTDFNSSKLANGYRIAPVIVELDNHYRGPEKPPGGGTSTGQTLLPPATAFGAREAIETFARAAAYRLARKGCVFTIFPGLHPGLVAPLGWELSGGARDDLKHGLTVVPPISKPGGSAAAEDKIHRLQLMLGQPIRRGVLRRCLPRIEAAPA